MLVYTRFLNIFNIFTKIKDKLIRYGGHDLAAGFIAKADELHNIERLFSEEVKKIDKEKEYKRLAKVMRTHLDMDKIYSILK